MDVFDGAGGTDAADFSPFGAAVWVWLGYGAVEAWTRGTQNLDSGEWRGIADLNGIENVVGTSYADFLKGDAGANTFSYTGGFDTIDGVEGTDTVDFSRFGSAVWVWLGYGATEAWTRDTLNLDSGTWRGIADLNSIENVVGTPYADMLKGDAGANTFFYTGGLDTIDGVEGVDTVDFSRFGSAMWVWLGYGTTEAWTRDTQNLDSGAWKAIVDLDNIENVVGTAYSDFLKGDTGANRFFYTGGLDTIDGVEGIDTADFSRYDSAVWVWLGYGPRRHGPGVPWT